MTRLEELWDELRKGKVYECNITDPNAAVEGLMHEGKIWIDPRWAVLEVLLHELLHRRYPKMSERAVMRESRRVFLQSVAGRDDVVRKWWRAYCRIRKRWRGRDD